VENISKLYLQNNPYFIEQTLLEIIKTFILS